MNIDLVRYHTVSIHIRSVKSPRDIDICGTTDDYWKGRSIRLLSVLDFSNWGRIAPTVSVLN